MVTFSTIGGAVCLDFSNTGGQRQEGPFEEKLGSYDALVAWAESQDLLTSTEAARLREQAARASTQAQQVLLRGRELREAIYRVFSARVHEQPVDARDLQLISDEYARATAHRILAPTESGAIDFKFADEDALDRPLWPVAISAANLAASEEAARVKECAKPNCNWLFYDVSKNRSRRWCEMKECGNRAKARRHYERHRGNRSDS